MASPQHWLIVTWTAHYLPTFLRLLSFISPLSLTKICNEKLLKVPRKNLKACAHRSLSYQARTVWNSLPSAIRQSPSLVYFKTNLKTHRFVKSFHHFQEVIQLTCPMGKGRKRGERVCACVCLYLQREETGVFFSFFFFFRRHRVMYLSIYMKEWMYAIRT